MWGQLMNLREYEAAFRVKERHVYIGKALFHRTNTKLINSRVFIQIFLLHLLTINLRYVRSIHLAQLGPASFLYLRPTNLSCLIPIGFLYRRALNLACFRLLFVCRCKLFCAIVNFGLRDF
jgi:hypothetical protein